MGLSEEVTEPQSDEKDTGLGPCGCSRWFCQHGPRWPSEEHLSNGDSGS